MQQSFLFLCVMKFCQGASRIDYDITILILGYDIEVVVEAPTVADVGDAVLATQALQQDANLVLGGEMPLGRYAD